MPFPYQRLKLTEVEDTDYTFNVEIDVSGDGSGDYVWQARFVVFGDTIRVTRGGLSEAEIAAIPVEELLAMRNMVVVL